MDFSFFTYFGMTKGNFIYLHEPTISTQMNTNYLYCIKVFPLFLLRQAELDIAFLNSLYEDLVMVCKLRSEQLIMLYVN